VHHTMTYDNVDRVLTVDYGTENCGVGQPVDISYTYDSPPVSCPTGATCTHTAGHLAHVRSTLLCSTAYSDKTLDQEVFYAYDPSGRLVEEFLRDDAGRTALQSYGWTKNGKLQYADAPDGTSEFWSYDGTVSGNGNSDANVPGAVVRNTTAIATDVVWAP